MIRLTRSRMTRNARATGILLCLFFAFGLHVSAQTYLEQFGQNRVQYRKFDWKYFETEHFQVYHYDAAGRQLARFLAEQAEQDIRMVEQRLGGQFPETFKIILYNSYDDYRQTNVGKQYESPTRESPAGMVDLAGDRLVVYFTGQHTDLRRQLRAGMSKVVMQRMLFGENLREMVRNAVLLNLPEWTTEGFIAHLVDGWDSRTESAWKNLMAANPRKGFFELSEQEPEIAGKAFWKYITEKYGEEQMKTLLYTMELKSSLNQGIKMALGQDVRQAYDSCMSFYRTVYSLDSLGQQQPDSNYAILSVDMPEPPGRISQVRVSPRGNDVAYVTWQHGEFRVYMQHTQKEKSKSLILSGGQKDFNENDPDPDYPILAWSNNGYKLAVLYRQGRRTRLRIYNSIKGKIENYNIPFNRFDRVTGISFMEDDAAMVFSAIRRSQSDLYEFRIRGSRMKNITSDRWDDLQPWFVSGGSRRGILFLSNRPAPSLDVSAGVNELPTGQMNLFFYDTRTGSSELLQCSDLSSGTVTQPIQYGSDNFAFLHDANGVMNKYVVMFGRDGNNRDSAYAVPVTNYTSGILSHQYNPAGKKASEVVQEGGRLKIYSRDVEIPDPETERKVLMQTLLSGSPKSPVRKPAGDPRLPENLLPAREKRGVTPERAKETLFKEGNVFRSEFSDQDEKPVRTEEHVHPEPEGPAEQVAPEIEEFTPAENIGLSVYRPADSTYLKMRPKPYRLNFKPDFFTVRLDNSILFMRYQSVNQNPGAFVNPPLGGLLTISLNDVMENHRFTGGMNLPVNFSGLTYFLQYENFTRRVDWSLLYLRSERSYVIPVTFVDMNTGIPVFTREYMGKTIVNLLQGSASYPLDRVRSIRMHLGVRQDVLNFKAHDTLSLVLLPRERQYWMMSRAEYVFDNSRSPVLNIRQGFRYKYFAEYMYRLGQGAQGFYNFGTDFRYYQKVYKHITLATRLAAAHSAGNQKIMYMLGGVDNWIGPRVDNHAAAGGDGSYAFRTLATNMRGYRQNARSGSSYAVLNAELRFPVVASFIRRPLQSSLLRHLQLVPFTDVGSAWTGLLPNAENTSVRYRFGPDQQAPAVTMEVQVPGSGGLAMGYGTGLRTMVFGYFVRLDAAWSIEGSPRPMWYFSIGTDF